MLESLYFKILEFKNEKKKMSESKEIAIDSREKKLSLFSLHTLFYFHLKLLLS
jgi:hypothetical protein